MAYDPAALKAADTALAISDPAAAAAALNAQTVVVPSDVPTATAREVLLISGEFYAVKQLSKATAPNPDPSNMAMAIAVADIAVDTFTLTDTLHFADNAKWAAIQPMMNALKAAGVVSQATLDAWSAMRNKTMPVWPVVITAADVTAVRSR